MALINCPECGKEVSDAAKNCPNCGYPLDQPDSPPPPPPPPKKKNGCLTGCLVTILFFAAVFLIFSFIPNKKQIKQESVPTPVIMDVPMFFKLSSTRLIEKLGDPVRIEDIIMPNGATGYNYWYDIDGHHYDFYLVDDKVVELIISSENFWTGSGKLFTYQKSNKSDIAECFNIKLNKTAKTEDNNINYNATEVAAGIPRINVQNIDSINKTYSLIKIIYDNSFFE